MINRCFTTRLLLSSCRIASRGVPAFSSPADLCSCKSILQISCHSKFYLSLGLSRCAHVNFDGFSFACCAHEVGLDVSRIGQSDDGAVLYYSPSDFRVGGFLQVYGRNLFLCGADNFTRERLACGDPESAWNQTSKTETACRLLAVPLFCASAATVSVPLVRAAFAVPCCFFPAHSPPCDVVPVVVERRCCVCVCCRRVLSALPARLPRGAGAQGALPQEPHFRPQQRHQSRHEQGEAGQQRRSDNATHTPARRPTSAKPAVTPPAANNASCVFCLLCHAV